MDQTCLVIAAHSSQNGNFYPKWFIIWWKEESSNDEAEEVLPTTITYVLVAILQIIPYLVSRLIVFVGRPGSSIYYATKILHPDARFVHCPYFSSGHSLIALLSFSRYTCEWGLIVLEAIFQIMKYYTVLDRKSCESWIPILVEKFHKVLLYQLWWIEYLFV